PGAHARRAGARGRLAAPVEAPRVARGRLAAGGRRNLGGTRPRTSLYALEDDGVGRLRPGGSVRRGARPRGSARPLASAARRDPPGRLRARVGFRAEDIHAVIWIA